MMTIYMICAAVGGVILICQLVMTLIGLGGGHGLDVHPDVGAGGHDFHMGPDHDAGQADHGASWYFGVLSFRALVAASTFFGLGGLTASAGGVGGYLSFVSALTAGAMAMIVVAWLLRAFQALRSEGNVYIGSAVGATGTVYLTIPGQHAGMGKVTVQVQNRTMEYQAMTEHEALSTGTPVVVVRVVSPDTVQVAPVSK